MSFEDLLSQEMIERALTPAEVLPPRPEHTAPEYAITHKGKVMRLKRMTTKQWEFFDFKKVTGTGWAGWYPVTYVDRLSFATRRKGKAAQKKLRLELPGDDYLLKSMS